MLLRDSGDPVLLRDCGDPVQLRDSGDAMLLRDSKGDKKEKQQKRHLNDDGNDDNDEGKKGEDRRDFSGATGQKQLDRGKIDECIEKKTPSEGRAVDHLLLQPVTKDIALIF